MNKSALSFVFCFFTLCFSFSQENNNKQNTFIGINPAVSLTVGCLSTIMDPNTTYIPVHIVINHSFSKHFGLSGLLLYRLEKDNDFKTNEIGFAVGPSYLSNELSGFFADLKFGIGLAAGQNNLKEDYTRTDLIIQPDIGFFKKFSGGFAMSFGLGLQSLLKITENPPREGVWDWNATGTFSHYYLPVLNISLGYTF
jgi:hypothetical protein